MSSDSPCSRPKAATFRCPVKSKLVGSPADNLVWALKPYFKHRKGKARCPRNRGWSHCQALTSKGSFCRRRMPRTRSSPPTPSLHFSDFAVSHLSLWTIHQLQTCRLRTRQLTLLHPNPFPSLLPVICYMPLGLGFGWPGPQT